MGVGWLGPAPPRVVQASYANVAVSAASSSEVHWSGTTKAMVQNSYATGPVAGLGDVGGLVGNNQGGGGTTLNSWWDTQTSGRPISQGGIGLTTRQLQGLDPINSVLFSTVTNLGDTNGTVWAAVRTGSTRS